MSPTQGQHYFETQSRPAVDPLSVAVALAGSGPYTDHVVYENGGDWAYAGGSIAEITLDRTGARLRQGDAPEVHLPWTDRPLDLVRELLARVDVPEWRAYGWSAFELSYAKDGDLTHVGDGPLLRLVVPAAEVRLRAGHAHLRAADQETLAALLHVVNTAEEAPERAPRPLDVRGTGEAEYREAVKRAVDDINQGELHKVILSRVVDVPHAVDLAATYVAGRRGNNPARSFLLHMDGLEAAGFSPEIVVRVDEDGHVVSQPLAGTRALTPDLLANEELRKDLLASSKEVYEHAISVKVGTDELADVCEPGSVDVPEFMTIRERGSVQHLASRVSGRLAEGRGAWDGFGAVFPAVTASGVPKGPAYEVIRRYESETRGLYSGTVMTVDHTGAMDAALVLRSVYRQDGRTWLRAGAGIVGQSTPEREYEETCEKLDSVARHLVPAAE
ncbi:salicylate synthase [Streptomyces huiliensis]|uniref:salicylate synthase n=1 Tax=Streptomyces huiliensis TaxID=2876027 RepID=UPI001CBDD33B|nr:salicylate synthase [Streptomyces huiliensis]MBZ4323658.1 salicylate synthase [Streptomyces huiliensis]